MTAVLALSACGGGNGEVAGGESRHALGGAAPAPEPLVDAQRLAAGHEHVVGLGADGRVYAWGRNDAGQLGTVSGRQSDVPVLIAGMSGVKAVEAGAFATVMLKQDGTVWVLTPRGPQLVPGLVNVKAIAAGQSHVLALQGDGNVWGWGRGGNATGSATPAVVAGLSHVKAISAGQDYSVALKADGSVWTWGVNQFGQLGNGGTAYSAQPGVIVGLSNVRAVSAGEVHALALKDDGTVWGWGNNSYGQLGGTIYYARSPVAVKGLPVPVAGMSGVKSVVAGAYNSGVVNWDGGVWVWGNNHYGQLGNGSHQVSYAPLKVNAVSDAVTMAIGSGFISVLKADGAVYSFGRNNSGQLGNNTRGNSSVPTQAVGIGGFGNLNLGASVSR
ncbi:RCC1 domain-containing protein [Pseudoduganella namucuonensis]|nr:hypothetical protein [Pseudoduganella namucuonensis]